MKTHAQIIVDAGGATEFARKISEEPNTAQAWKRLNSIPARYWRSVVDAGLATFDELADAAAARQGEAA